MHYSRSHDGLRLSQAKKLKRVWLERSQLNAGRFYGNLTESSSDTSDTLSDTEEEEPWPKRKKRYNISDDDSENEETQNEHIGEVDASDDDQFLALLVPQVYA